MVAHPDEEGVILGTKAPISSIIMAVVMKLIYKDRHF